MRRPSLGKNYGLHLAYQVMSIALPLITTPYLSRVLGADGIGRYSFAQSIVSYFALAAALGSTLYGQRRIARVSHDPEARSRAFFEIFLFRIAGAAVAALLYAALVLPFASDRLLYVALGLEIASVALDVSWFFQGMEDFVPIALGTAVGRGLAIVAIFALVKDRGDLAVYVVCYGASLLVGHLLSFMRLGRYLVRTPRRRLRVASHVLPSLALFGSQLAIVLYTVLDKTMIGLVTASATENGYYEQSQKLIRVLVALVTSLGTVMASRVAVLWREKQKGDVYELLYGSLGVTLALGFPVAVGGMLIASRFVPLFYGAEFAPVAPILSVLVWMLPLLGGSNVIGIQLLVPTGREGVLTRSLLAGAAVNVGLNGLLIPRYGAMGAAIASVAAECAVTAAQLVAVRRELDLWRMAGIALRYAILGALMGTAGLCLFFVAPGGVLGILWIVLPCAGLYAALLLALRDPVLRFFKGR